MKKKTNQKSITTLDKGYLLSPRDNLGIEYLPELIKMGIDSLKIEGRMKTPTYVGVVTRIYRKYIDYVYENINLDNNTLKNNILNMMNHINENTGLTDKEELTQVFNRGGFSTGHFKPTPNKELIFKEKPNNMGIYIGTIQHINENKGHLKLKLENSLSIGDKIQINNDSYTISELMRNHQNFETLPKGEIVTIGRMKGNLSVGNKVYRIESAQLNKSISPTFKENKNFKKIKLNGEITLEENKPITFKVWSHSGFYKNVAYTVCSSFLPQKALNKPLTEEKIIEHLCKTGNTEFEFETITVKLNGNLFLPTSTLNDLRRDAIEGLENCVLEKYTRNLKELTIQEISPSSHVNDKKDISLLLNKIDETFLYSELKNINRIYIPLKYFLNHKYQKIINTICNQFDTFIYLPIVLRDKVLDRTNFKEIIDSFSIKGFVISNISQIEIVKNCNLPLIGNYNLNIYNSHSIQMLKELGLSEFTISPELDTSETNTVLEKSCIPSEIIIYGKLPVMTNHYCYLGKSNQCYDTCSKKCLENNHYYLSDRMNFHFEIIPDNFQTITTIYNSKILSVTPNIFKSNSIRIDILDEDFNQIQTIINTVKTNQRFEGKDFTNGKYERSSL